MAFIGLRYVVAATAAEAPGAITYSNGFVVGKAVTAEIKVNSAGAKQYGDDAIAESENSFTDGTVDVSVVHMTDDIQTKLLGHKAAEEGKEIVSNTSDVAPYLGFGFYAVKMENNRRRYRAIFFTKVQFAEPSESLATKQGAVSFSVPTLNGTIMEDITGNWKREQTFDTITEAQAYLDKLVGLNEEMYKAKVNKAKVGKALAGNE